MAEQKTSTTNKSETMNYSSEEALAGAVAGKDDRFDPTRLRLSQDFEELGGVKKAIITVPVRRPTRQEFFRTHSLPSMRLDTAVLEVKLEREIYLVDSSIRSVLGPELAPVRLHAAINRANVVFLMPVRLPGVDGRDNEWWRSLREASEIATRKWVRIAPNASLGAYEVFEPRAELPEPEWPDVDLPGLLRIAFGGRFIDSLDHVVVQTLLGAM
jgi:hypothetical protein